MNELRLLTIEEMSGMVFDVDLVLSIRPYYKEGSWSLVHNELLSSFVCSSLPAPPVLTPPAPLASAPLLAAASAPAAASASVSALASAPSFPLSLPLFLLSAVAPAPASSSSSAPASAPAFAAASGSASFSAPASAAASPSASASVSFLASAFASAPPFPLSLPLFPPFGQLVGADKALLHHGDEPTMALPPRSECSPTAPASVPALVSASPSPLSLLLFLLPFFVLFFLSLFLPWFGWDPGWILISTFLLLSVAGCFVALLRLVDGVVEPLQTCDMENCAWTTLEDLYCETNWGFSSFTLPYSARFHRVSPNFFHIQVTWELL